MSEQLTIIYEPAPEGGFTAYIPEVPGAVSEGETIEEAREMVLDAMREVLDFRRGATLSDGQEPIVTNAVNRDFEALRRDPGRGPRT